MSKPKYTLFRPRIRSRHPSHDVLRQKDMPLLPFKSVIRLGSQTEFTKDTNPRIEINTVGAIETSSNKFLMKEAFRKGDVQTADWFFFDKEGNLKGPDRRKNYELSELEFPIISKNIFGSRNRGNRKHDTLEELQSWLEGKKNLNNYIFEKYYNYTREYRLHVTEDGYFYACRKMLKADTPEEHKWYRNDEHCVWIMEDNELFDTPINWKDVVKQCVKALKAVGLDVGACDVRIQSATTSDGEKQRKEPKFIIVEINSAPSFGDVTEQKYKEELPKILKKKFELSKT